ncbi:MAG TPA: AzlC family ABC transporter permease [Thermodesulfobacteriota bacterium]|jgi:4-azaleucine resistance transporter AzlC|nr:AzlC family ABC transporter permease [Thermodesulfobacteriota bacterium]
MDNHQFKEGMKAALPIVLGYLPVGMAFGVLARKAGLTTFDAGLMSLLVYAGASQFIAIEMISKGISWFPIVIATFFVNLRHLLMSSTLSLYFQKNRFRTFSLLAAQLTDESFAVAMSNTSKVRNRPSYLFGLQMTSQLAWIAGSIVGALFGKLIDHREYGIPFALPSLFICLLVIQINKVRHLWVMVIAGISSIFFKWAFSGNWYILLTGLLASGIGMVIETKLVPSPSTEEVGTNRNDCRADTRNRGEGRGER